jgi:hypothetical protein
MKKAIALIVWLMLVFGLAGTAAANNPPWPATVFDHREVGECQVTWFDSEMNFILIPGQGVSVYQEKTGNWSGHCNAFVDFNDPDIATLSQFCADGYWGQFCNGNGSAIARGFECTLLALGLTTYDSIHRIQPSGNIELFCRFNGAAP